MALIDANRTYDVYGGALLHILTYVLAGVAVGVAYDSSNRYRGALVGAAAGFAAPLVYRKLVGKHAPVVVDATPAPYTS